MESAEYLIPQPGFVKYTTQIALQMYPPRAQV